MLAERRTIEEKEKSLNEAEKEAVNEAEKEAVSDLDAANELLSDGTTNSSSAVDQQGVKVASLIIESNSESKS